MTNKQLLSLYGVAAEMAKGLNMPSPYEEDWDFLKTTPIKERRRVLLSAEKARVQCGKWAIALREVIEDEPKNY